MSYGTENAGSGALLFLAAALVAAGGAGYWYSEGGKAVEPETGGVKMCSTCKGSGRAECGTCGGLGKVRYIQIGSGRSEVRTCGACNGSNKVRCSPCHGNGKIFPK